MTIALPRPSKTVTPGVARLVYEVTGSTGELAGAVSLPPGVYTSPEFHDFEREAVFASSWVYLCHVSTLPEPGSYLGVTVADEPLVVTRAADGGIRVLSSLCRHRSYPIVEDHEKGRTQALRCPYHYWSYDLDGSLQTAPTMEPAHTLQELRSSMCLPSHAVEIWHGFVFVHLGEAPEPLSPRLSSLEDEFAAHRTEDLVVGDSVVLEHQPWNWKNMLENALEAYHTSFLHKGYHDNAPARLVQFLPFDAAADDGIMRFAPFLQEGGGMLTADGKAAFPLIDGLSREQRSRIVFASVPPGLFVSMKPDGVMVFRILPESHDRMTLAVDWLYTPEALEQSNFDELLAKQRAYFDTVNGQDSMANERMYRALSSRSPVRGPYAPQEATLPQFNEWLLRRYRAAL